MSSLDDRDGTPSGAPPRRGRPPFSAAAVSGFVLALVSLALSWLFMVLFLSLIVLGPLATLVSIVGIVRARGGRFRGRGLAVAGLVIALLSMIIAVIAQVSLWNFDGYLRE